MAVAEAPARAVLRYIPREPFVPFHARTQRWAVVVAHRRAGKTVACVMDLLTAALSTQKPDARYGFLAPYREQVKLLAWTYLKRYAAPIVRNPAEDLRESDLSVRLPNGSQVRLFGADNPNALRGMYLDGVVMDEYPHMRPGLWGDVIRPALSDRAGWGVFIGTPEGKNAFYDLHLQAQRDGWFHRVLRASETGILSQAELEDARRTMTEAQYEQEYECSFEVPVMGAYYSAELAKARAEGRIGKVPHTQGIAVNTFWDIGVNDTTAIWCHQSVARQDRFLKCYEAAGEPFAHFAKWLLEQGYVYGTHYLPHDAEHRRQGLDDTDSALEMLQKLLPGHRFEVVPRVPDVLIGIQQTRDAFGRYCFDESGCAEGLAAVENYRKKWIESQQTWATHPDHDWTSNYADALRQHAQGYEPAAVHKPRPRRSLSHRVL